MVNIEQKLGMLCEILTFKTSHYCNLFVAAMSTAIFIAHAGSGSKTEAFCKEIISWQKPIYTFDSDYNKNLVEMGAQPIDTGGGSGLATLLNS